MRGWGFGAPYLGEQNNQPPRDPLHIAKEKLEKNDFVQDDPDPKKNEWVFTRKKPAAHVTVKWQGRHDDGIRHTVTVDYSLSDGHHKTGDLGHLWAAMTLDAEKNGIKMVESVAKALGYVTEAVYRGFKNEHNGELVLLYAGKSGDGAALAVAKRRDGDYDVMSFKKNRVIGSHQLLRQSAESDFSHLRDIAIGADVFKKQMIKLTPAAMGAFLLKDGVSTGTIEKLFPTLLAATAETHGTKAACFTLIGMQPKMEIKVRKVVDHVSQLLHSHGFGHLCYGDVIYSKLSTRVAADYQDSTDKMRVSPQTKLSFEDEVRIFIHELGHRQQHKFHVDKAKLEQKYLEASGQRPERLKPGQEVESPQGRKIVITGLKLSGRKIAYSGHYADDDVKRGLIVPAAAETWKIIKGDQPKRHEFSVSAYAMTKSSEFWAEVFSFAVTSRPDLLPWVKEVAK